MRFLSLCLLLTFAAPSFGQAQPLHGIDTSDINRSAKPCDDFFEFANGKWRAENPIPPSMVRWSKRWQAGEKNKDVLHSILEDAAAKSASAAPGSTERLIGDYYGSCMDEKQADAQGIKPLQSDLKAIRSIKSTKDLQRVIARLDQWPFLPRFSSPLRRIRTIPRR